MGSIDGGRAREVVVAIERDSAMAPKKVDYAVVPSSVSQL